MQEMKVYYLHHKKEQSRKLLVYCILRSVTDVDAFQSGRFAKQNGRPETQIFLLTLSV